MKAKIINAVLFFSLLAAMSACKKDNTSQPPPVVQTKRVSKIANSATDFRTFQYDASGRLTRYYTQWADGTGGTMQVEMLLQYSNGKLVRANYGSGHVEFNYQGDVLKSADNFNAANVKTATWLYSFNAQGKLAAVLEQEANPEPDQPVETRTKFLYAVNGNLSKVEYSIKAAAGEPFEDIYSEEYVSYDGKKSGEPVSVLGYYIPGVVFYSGNPTRINRLSQTGGVDGYTKLSYEYDADGYPTKKTQIVGVGPIETVPLTFNYTY